MTTWLQRCGHYLRQLTAWWYEASRDRVAESFALRYKALDVRRAALDRNRALMRGDKEGAATHEEARARFHREWEQMADSYERRWFSKEAKKGA